MEKIIKEFNEGLQKRKEMNLIEWLKRDIDVNKSVLDKIPSLSREIKEKEFLLEMAKELAEQEHNKGMYFAFLSCYQYIKNHLNLPKEICDDYLRYHCLEDNKIFIDMIKDMVMHLNSSCDTWD